MNIEIENQINSSFREGISNDLQETTLNSLIEFLDGEHSTKEEVVNGILNILEDEIR